MSKSKSKLNLTSISVNKKNDQNHATKVALITGGAIRIGRAISQKLAESGYSLAIHYAKSKIAAIELQRELVSKYPIKVKLYQHQFSNKINQQNCQKIIKKIYKDFGRLDLLVNNAAIFEYDNCKNINPRILKKHLAINFSAPIFLMQEFFSQVDKYKSKKIDHCIINILDHKLFAVNPDFFSYTVTKSALFFATKMAAIEYAPKIRVCGIAPGLTIPSKYMTAKSFAKAHKKALTGSAGNPEDIAQSVIFLANNQSITGEVICVDGGQSYKKLTRDVSFT